MTHSHVDPSSSALVTISVAPNVEEEYSIVNLQRDNDSVYSVSSQTPRLLNEEHGRSDSFDIDGMAYKLGPLN